MAEVLWYYAKNDQQLGPVSPAELKQLAATHLLLPEDLIWRDGMEAWAPAARVKGLFPEPREIPSNQNGGRSSDAVSPMSAVNPLSTIDATPAPASSQSSADFLLSASVVPEATGRVRTTESDTVNAAQAGKPDLLWLSQFMLWGICIGTVIVGGLMFTIAYLRAGDSHAEADSAAAVFAAFSVAAYILARAGERIATLLQAYFNRPRP